MMLEICAFLIEATCAFGEMGCGFVFSQKKYFQIPRTKTSVRESCTKV